MNGRATLTIVLTFLTALTHAELVGVDFGPKGKSPQNWNSVSSNGNYLKLINDEGQPTVVGLHVRNAGTPYAVTPSPASLPEYKSSLAALDGNLYQFGGTFEAQINGLIPLQPYKVYVFGLRGGAGTQQSISMAGGKGVVVSQSAPDGVLTVNDQPGDSQRTLASYAKSVVASRNGTIDFAVTGGPRSNQTFVVAGLAIEGDFPGGAATMANQSEPPAQQSTDSIGTGEASKQPAAASTSADVNVVGLELGMTQEELLTAMRRHNAKLNLMEHTSDIVVMDSYRRPFQVGSYVAEIQGFWDPRARGYKPSDPRELISVVFAGPPNEHRVESILREVRYVDRSTYPGYEPLVAALIGKYGPAHLAEQNSAITQLVWQLDGQSLTERHLNMLGGSALNPNNNHSTRYHLFPIIDESLPPNVLSISDDGVTIRHGNRQYIEGGRFLAIHITQQGSGVHFMRAVLQDSMMKIGRARGATAQMANAALARHEQQERESANQRSGPDI